MFAVLQESVCNLIMSIGRRCHGGGINHPAEIIKRFGRCCPEFARNGAAPERLDVVYRGELRRRSFRIEPCMIASDMPNTNNANAQLFHRSLLQSTPKAFAGQRLKAFSMGQVRSARCADRTPQR